MRIIIVTLLLILSNLSFGNNPFWQEQKDSTKIKQKKKGLSLEKGRDFSFDLTEGSWISLDVSPDGKIIVFDFLGDLYTLPLEGGLAIQLTEGLAFDSQPRFSPDGKEVVYISDESGGENVWTIDIVSKKKRQITKSNENFYQSPEWTPDGKYIIASKQSSRRNLHKIWLYHTAGGSGTALVSKPEQMRMLEGAFGANERFIWFSSRTGSWSYNAPLPQYQIAKYDRESGEIVPQVSRYGSSFRPTLSSDGKWMVYGTRHDDQTGLVLKNMENGDENWLAYPVQHDDQESRASRDVLPGFSFTPDNRFIVVSYEGKIWKIDISAKTSKEIPFRVKSTIGLGPELDFDYPIVDTPEFDASQIRDLAPSPDGKQLAFTALNQIYLMDLPNGEPKLLTNLNETLAHPAWSPDGNWLAFISWTPDGGKLYKIQKNGRRLTQLNKEDGVFQRPAWSNDGKKIVMEKGSAEAFRNAVRRFAFQGTSELIWISSDGSKNNLIVNTKGRGNPHFIKGSDRIYLSGNAGLSSIAWDGTNEKIHVKVTGKKSPDRKDPPAAFVIKMAPIGDQALAQINSDLYAVTVPFTGKKISTISVSNPTKAAFPSVKLTEIGGEFPAWSPNGKVIHWAIGNAHVQYDLEASQLFYDSVSTADPKGKIRFKPNENRIKVKVKRDLPKGTLLLKNARIITMKGDEIIEGGDLLIEDNRIKEVGKGISAPKGAKIMDMSGKTIIPGFVDTHSHFRHPVGLHRKQFWPYLTNLAFGVITTRDPQTSTTDVLTYADLVDAGTLIGPRIYSTGPGIFRSEVIGSQEHANNVMKRYSTYYDTKTIKMYGTGNRQQRQWLIQAAREQKIMPTTEGGLDFKANLTQVIDGYPGHEHSFPIFPLYRDAIDLVAFSRTVYTPTLLVAYGGPWSENYYYATENPHADKKLTHFMPHSNLDQRTRRRNAGWFMEEEYVFKEQSAYVKELIAVGGRAGVGSHGQLQGLGYHWELWAMQSGGMSTHNTLKVATIIGADAIGLDNDLGSLEVGKLADLIILDKNPLENIRYSKEISHVMKNGRLYDGNTLDEIYPNPKKLEKMWWQEYAPVNVPGVGKK